MTPGQLAAQAAYISGHAIQTMVHRLEVQHALTLSDESRVRLHRELRPIVESVVRQSLEQEAAIHA